MIDLNFKTHFLYGFYFNFYSKVSVRLTVPSSVGITIESDSFTSDWRSVFKTNESYGTGSGFWTSPDS